MGLSELRRDSRAVCWREAGGFEHEGAPPDGSIRPGTELRTALCISPDVRGAEDGFQATLGAQADRAVGRADVAVGPFVLPLW